MKMSSDAVTLMVSTGIGVSVIAGILSGVCYILAHGLRKQRGRRSAPQWHCAVCNVYLRSIEGILEGETVVTCSKCSKRVCKRGCCKYIDRTWTCQLCLNEPWFQTIINAIPNKRRFLSKFRMSTERIDEIDEDIEAIRKKEKEQVRDFIERLVTAMLGGNVDDASISRIYNDKQYDVLFERYHQDLSNALIDLGSALHISIANLPVSGQSPCTAHATLKQLIERLLRESLNLSGLNNRTEEHPAVPSDENERTYEDLLATAILNKVVSSCQNNLPSSSTASVSSRLSTSSKHKDDKEYFFGEETLETKWKNTELDTTSVSSLEEWLQSDSSLSSTKYVDRVSLTIQQSIEEVSPTDSEEEDDSEYFRSSSALLTAEESNWYLQKRQFHGTHSPVPVPMLVPNPISDAKVLIGDRELDETSDLSDAASDYGDTESIPGIKSLLVESKMVIGGKNVLSSIHTSDAESSADSGVREDRDDDEEKPKTDATVDDENVEDASLLSVYSNTEKDTEYTEKYASLPRTIQRRSPSPRPENVAVKEEEEEKMEEFSGCYSKKEKEKWKNPIAMENNPYTKENIEKRIRSSETFGRDYYLRQASLPSGSKKTEENRIFGNDEDDHIFKAIPTFITEDDSIEPIISLPESRDTVDGPPSEVTSDSDLSFVNCYDVENSKVYRRSSDGGESEVTISVNTEGLLYIPKDPEAEETKIVNPAGSLYRAPSPQPPKQFESRLNANLKLHGDETFQKYQPEFEIRVNTEGLLYDPKSQRDENFNVAAEETVVPQIAPRTFVTPKPVPQRRNKIDENKTDKGSDYSFNTPQTIISKKSDNTLIRKIYSDPVVRSFALTNREQIPIKFPVNEKKPVEKFEEINQKPRETFAIETTQKPRETFAIKIEKIDPVTKEAKTNDSSFSEEFSDSNNFSLEFSDIEPVQRQGSVVKDPEITELKEKRLVASRLGEFSKSFPNLSKIQPLLRETSTLESPSRAITSFANLVDSVVEEGYVSVKHLKKRFEINDAAKKGKPVHSLTARSISKPMREKLKSEDSTEVVESASQEETGEIELVTINTENAIKFYETLNDPKKAG